MPEVAVQVFSDVICPWCFIGKRLLDKARVLLTKECGLRVFWKPFQLNPGMPPEGLERRVYRTAKFGSWERSQALDERLRVVAAAEDIHFAFERIERTPNTFDAHRLIWLAGREDLQHSLVETLFHLYFVEGADVGSRRTLVSAAESVGMDPRQASSFLESQEGVQEVREEESRARRMGVDAVPHFLINDEVISGAQETSFWLSVLENALRA